MDLYNHLIQLFLGGLTSGSIYSLMAISLIVVYRVSNLICFSQGEFFVVGALTLSSLLSFGFNIIISFPISLILSMILGGILYVTIIKRLQGRPIGVLIVITIGISFFLRGIALIIWGRSSYIINPFSSSGSINILNASLHPQVLWIIGCTAVIFLLMWIFYEKTTIGIAMRACAENPLGARLMGIDVKKLSLYAWICGSGIGSIAGMVIAPLLFVQYTSGVMPMIKGFIAMSIGGLNSISGSAIAGLMIGIIESYTIGLFTSKFSDVIVFCLLICILYFRPKGLFAIR